MRQEDIESDLRDISRKYLIQAGSTPEEAQTRVDEEICTEHMLCARVLRGAPEMLEVGCTLCDKQLSVPVPNT